MAKSDFVRDLTCPHIRELQPYESARRLFSGGKQWLNANESPFDNAMTINQNNWNRYPDCQPDALLAAYADYAGLAADQVLASRGADEGIELLIRAFCQPGVDRVLICPPTYGMYAISAKTFHVGVEQAPLLPDFSLDMAALTRIAEAPEAPPKLVFLCSPNNPTGTRIPPEQIRQVQQLFAGKSLVVVDEAYIEFDPQYSQAPSLEGADNLVILRTLSKAYALAGLRCGFVLSQPAIIKVLLKVIAPYPISAPVAQIACAALSPEGHEQMQQQVNYLDEQKVWLKQQLVTLGDIQLVGDDKANFVLFRTAQKQGLMDHLVAQGMLIRDQSKQQQLGNCLRVSVSSDSDNQRLIELITEFYQQ